MQLRAVDKMDFGTQFLFTDAFFTVHLAMKTYKNVSVVDKPC